MVIVIVIGMLIFILVQIDTVFPFISPIILGLVPGTCLSFALGFEPSKRRSKLQSKQGLFGFQAPIFIRIFIININLSFHVGMYIYIYGTINHMFWGDGA